MDEDYKQLHCHRCEERVYFDEYSHSKRICWDCVHQEEEKHAKETGFGPLLEIVKEIAKKA